MYKLHKSCCRKVFGNLEKPLEDKEIKDEPVSEQIDFDLLKPKVEIELDAEEFLESMEVANDVEETELETIHRRRGRKKLTNEFPCNICGKVFSLLLCCIEINYILIFATYNLN